MLAVVEEMKSILTIANALRRGALVYASIKGKSTKEQVKSVRACSHKTKTEVLTVFGWNHPAKVWSETPVASEADLDAAPATGYLQEVFNFDAPTH